MTSSNPGQRRLAIRLALDSCPKRRIFGDFVSFIRRTYPSHLNLLWVTKKFRDIFFFKLGIKVQQLKLVNLYLTTLSLTGVMSSETLTSVIFQYHCHWQ